MNISAPVTTVSGSPASRAAPAPHASGSRHRIQTATARVWQRAPLSDAGPERIARGLGWFSIALGLAELLAPRATARLWGGRGRHRTLVRLAGMREIATGLLILGQGRRPVAGMWARVAGDVADLAALSAAAASPNTNRRGTAFAAANVLGIGALDLLCAQELSRRQGLLTEDGAVRVTHSIVVNRDPVDVYRFWRDVENFPRFMWHLRSVRATGPDRSHWTTRGPRGSDVEWESEIVADHPGELIAWRSVEGSEVENAGTVRFEPRPGGRGTIVRVELEYRAPGGIAGAAVASLFNESPRQQLYDDLRRLKQVLETGEVVRSDACPHGTGPVTQRPAQPLGEAEPGSALHAPQYSKAR